MKKQYLFVIDPLEELNPKFDTSLLMMKELIKRGYGVSYCTPKEIFNDNGVIFSKSKWLTLEGDEIAHNGVVSSTPIRDFHKVFFRIDPPVDIAYFQAALLLSNETNVVNPTQKLIQYNEKIIAAELTEKKYDYLITKDFSLLQAFVDKNKVIVVKPINDYTGNRVFKIDSSEAVSENLKSIYDIVSNNGREYLLAQEFFEEIYSGDKRVFVCSGKVIGIANRIPPKGEFIANFHKGADKGAKCEKDTLTKIEKMTVDKVVDWMKKEQIVMAGLDFIGERLSEVNITSPSGIPQINEIYGTDMTPELIDTVLEA